MLSKSVNSWTPGGVLAIDGGFWRMFLRTTLCMRLRMKNVFDGKARLETNAPDDVF